MNAVIALSYVVLKEMYRRKDFYVLFVFSAVITLVLGSVSFFHDSHMARFLKEGCLLLIWLSGLAIAIGAAARQLPAERENRTIFPLLAKPVTRGHVIVGKFLGCWLATGAALLVFYVFFTVVSGAREHEWPLLQIVQALWLQWCMLGIIIAMTLLGSVIFAAPSSNATIIFVLVAGMLLLGRHLSQVAVEQAEPVRTILYLAYYLAPHLEWYDVRDLVIFDQHLVDWTSCALATGYAACYTGLFLFCTWLLFRRQRLNS